MLNSKINDVCKFLKSINIVIPPENEWLKSCVSCFITHSDPPNLDSLKSFVKEQWLLADLLDVSAPTLPRECKSAEKFVLTGTYAVQVNYAVNSAEPFYKQLQKIRRPEADVNLSVDVERDKNVDNIVSNRCLKIEITDGSLTVIGFEDELLKHIIEPVIPGSKALLYGPIDCRCGVLFLRNNSIKLLGGEVDTLLIKNAVENVLARFLGQVENPNPYKHLLNGEDEKNAHEALMDGDDDDLLLAAEAIEFGSCSVIQEEKESVVLVPQNISSPSDQIVISDDDDDEDFAFVAAQTASLAEKAVSKNLQTNASSSLSQIQKSQTDVKKKQANLSSFFNNNCVKDEKSKSPKRTKPLSENFDSAKSDNTLSSGTKARSSSVVSKQIKKTDKATKTDKAKDLREQLAQSYSGFNEVNSFAPSRQFNMDMPRSNYEEGKILVDSTKDSPLDNLQISTQEVQNSPPRKYIKPIALESFPPTSFPAERVVHGEVLRLSQKLSLQNNKWTLSAILKVHEREFEVDFSSETLDKIFGVSGSEIFAKKDEFKTNPKEKQRFNDILKNSQRRIKELSCNVKLHFLSYIAKPVITEIME